MSLNIASKDGMDRTAAALELIAAHLMADGATGFDPKAAQTAVRHGAGAAMYPVGTQIEIEHSTEGTHAWNVLDHDHDTDARGLLEHSMTIQMDDQLSAGMAWDAPEALVYASAAMAAATYHFSHAAALNDVPAGTYQFTLAQGVPLGGQIMLVKNGTAWRVQTFAGANSTTALETANCTSGSGGTSLGQIDDAAATHAGIQAADITAGTPFVVNIGAASQFGYNRWSQCALRQWLNSAEAAGAWWKPMNVFDRAPDYADTKAGFLAGLPSDLLAVLGQVTHSTALNRITDGGTCESVTDKVWLISRAEAGLGTENAGQDDGSVYAYWYGASAEDRIKLRGTSAATWWLRTPNAGYANYARNVISAGTLNNSYARYAYGVSPACCII